MAMTEFIYPIKDIFAGDGVLAANEAARYYIAPYQRGYKWGSECRYDAVPQMLVDLYDGMRHGTQEYFLHYITLMPSKVNGERVLEVIDGQQRLTTLSLIFYCLEKWYGIENITQGKVEYSRYNDSKSLFANVIDFVEDCDFDHAEISRCDTQDRYYMAMAARCIRKFLETVSAVGLLEDYVEYIRDNVLLIVNLESGLVSAEEVFANLNDNKVNLSDDELIKGLLLTLGVRHQAASGTRKRYKEILGQRAVMGRMWDEIYAWAQQPSVSMYLFGEEENGMKSLLSLIEIDNDSNYGQEDALRPFFEFFDQDGKKFENKYELFNKFNEAITTSEKAFDALNQLKHAYHTLSGIYNDLDDTLIYNLLGYSLFSLPMRDKGQRISILKALLGKSRSQKIEYLKADLKKRIPDMAKIKDEKGGYKALDYRFYNPGLTNLLLSFSVFPQENAKSYRFDFAQYKRVQWTFEHIFPQHPPKEVKFGKVESQLVINEINKFFKSEIEKEAQEHKKSDLAKQRDDLINKVKKGEKITVSDGLEFLYQTDLKDSELQSCGNMALLPGPTNTSLSNRPYLAKRLILMDKIAVGDFVPRHTIDIFNKNLIATEHPFNSEITLWNIQDITAHIEWMEQRNKQILDSLNQ